MTRDEAIEWMVFQKEQVLAMSGDKPGTLTVAFDMAIEALKEPNMIPIKLEKRYPESKDEDITDAFMQGYLKGKEAVQGYTEWLEKIIVEAEIEWLCEDTTDEEWCEKKCVYTSIQAECLRHLYEVRKGGDTE